MSRPGVHEFAALSLTGYLGRGLGPGSAKERASRPIAEILYLMRHTYRALYYRLLASYLLKGNILLNKLSAAIRLKFTG